MSCRASELQRRALSLAHRGREAFETLGGGSAGGQVARTGRTAPETPRAAPTTVSFWNRTAFVYDLATRAGDAGLAEAAAYLAGFLDPHDVILDAACGTGAFACALAPHVGFVGASDLAPKMVARARAKAARLGLENVAFGVGDLCALDFADATFDAAVAGNVLHLLNDPAGALAELTRVVRPGGIIGLPTYVNAEEQDTRFLKVIGAAGFSAVHEWTEATYLAFLADQGMDLVAHRLFAARQPLCVAVCRRA